MLTDPRLWSVFSVISRLNLFSFLDSFLQDYLGLLYS